ncbi:uroporphyrinogen-III synthase [Pseudoroseomonas cervicalis]|uniref:uroporphyrinogen-III synthase n=1 Tax=Teichococcus cervicalis TaxID=204525 RepID=UPI00278168A4|nr:uroporphyrinogen-III synthase [Pseudoroseomonas cervicalis]MDQ1079999.1 uroporphyrinogen-III synthase [Pseudoroseomonas cervicalis]
MSQPPAILVTRPEPGCAETMQAVAALGWRPVAAPALVLRPCAPATGWDRPTQALLLPSRASARALAPLLARGLLPAALPVLAVGPGTAEETRRAGFTDVLMAEGDAVSLAALAAARLDPKGAPLCLAAGQGYSMALASALRGHGFAVRRRVVYAAHPATALPEAAIAALKQGEIRAALFLSPRSAHVTQRLLRGSGLAETVRQVTALALSSRIAGALAGMPWQVIRATPVPDLAALLALLGPAPRPAPEGDGSEPQSEGQERA